MASVAITESSLDRIERLSFEKMTLALAGKHLAVKLAEVYRAAGANPAECQAIRDWVAALAKAEGQS
ncbi:MAG TPA: hypothetical protein VGN82_14415 [Bosea sp. (in: a-proteobacteria)]|jgi:hypothetical protein|uniref:hypothetical protein n=1 Tax=Bosea sp. (in: a-proteobacteria) TaxID=1871050 RepID=UPI002E0E8ABD|nr:hypothetical protein [Bosea sp. (in: a-proteobacteria)]